jgi:hypothetical protein
MSTWRRIALAATEKHESARQGALANPVFFYFQRFFVYAGAAALLFLVADTAAVDFVSSIPWRRLAFVVSWSAILAAVNTWDIRRGTPRTALIDWLRRTN